MSHTLVTHIFGSFNYLKTSHILIHIQFVALKLYYLVHSNH